jgi:hypothetical protein
MAGARDPIARLKAKIEKSGWGLSVDETMAFAKPELVILYDLWRVKADAMRALPRREDLDIRLLKPFLRHVSVVERLAGASGKSSYRIRLQGSFLVEHFGDQTGKLMEDAVPGDLAERWAGVYDAILDARRPLRLQGTYKQERMDYLVGESLSVPLGNGDAPPASVMSVTYYTPRYKIEEA